MQAEVVAALLSNHLHLEDLEVVEMVVLDRQWWLQLLQHKIWVLVVAAAVETLLLVPVVPVSSSSLILHKA
jgi:hypothetical protein